MEDFMRNYEKNFTKNNTLLWPYLDAEKKLLSIF